MGEIKLIETKELWFGAYIKSNEPIAWLRELEHIVAMACAADSARAMPAVCDVGAKIIGPVAFGKNCVVGHGALVVGPAIFGDDCVVGHASEVSRSIFGNRSRAAHFNYVGDSVVGSDVNLGAGAKLANVRFDKKSVNGLQKCGVILGDACQIGCNAVLSPGVVCASGVWFAGAHVPAGQYDRASIKKYFFAP